MNPARTNPASTHLPKDGAETAATGALPNSARGGFFRGVAALHGSGE